MVYVMCIFICKYDLHDIYAYIYIYIHDIHIIYFGIVIGLIFFWWIPLTHQAAPFLLGKCGIDWKPWNWRKMDRSGGREGRHSPVPKGVRVSNILLPTCEAFLVSFVVIFFVLVLHLKMFYYANFCSFITQIHHWHSNLLVQQNFEPETTNIHWSLMNFFFRETTAFFFLPLFLYNLDSSSFGKPDLRRLHQPDDLVSVSTENAKNLALSAMWCALPSSRNTRCAGGGMVVRWRTHPHTISL